MGKMTGMFEANYHAHQKRKVHIEQWGIDVWVSPVTLGQQIELNKYDDPNEKLAKLIQICAKDESGQRIIDDSDFAEWRAYGVGKHGAKEITKIAAQIGEAIGDVQTLEDAEGN